MRDWEKEYWSGGAFVMGMLAGMCLLAISFIIFAMLYYGAG